MNARPITPNATTSTAPPLIPKADLATCTNSICDQMGALIDELNGELMA